MALYDRFRGYDDNGQEVVKLPIWPTITSFTEILAGEQTDAGVIDRFNLDAGEQAEFAKVKTQIGTNITNLATSLITTGVDSDSATQIATSRDFVYVKNTGSTDIQVTLDNSNYHILLSEGEAFASEISTSADVRVKTASGTSTIEYFVET